MPVANAQPIEMRLMNRTPAEFAVWVQSLSKGDLYDLIDRVKAGDDEAISLAVGYVCSESFGIWHNRGRACLCRYFKNHPPGDTDCERMVNAILRRLRQGRFFEQFKDQLSMAIRFDPERLAQAADRAVLAEKDYIRRYGRWIQNVLASLPPPPSS